MQMIQYCKTTKEKKGEFFFSELVLIPVQFLCYGQISSLKKNSRYVYFMCSLFSNFWLYCLVTPAHPDVNMIYWTYCFSYESDFGWLLDSSLECNISFRHIDYSLPLSFTDLCPISIVPFCCWCTNALARTYCSYAPQRGLYWFLFRELRFQVLTATNMKTLLWTRWWTLVFRNMWGIFWLRERLSASGEEDRRNITFLVRSGCLLFHIGTCLHAGRCTA
jgi:hypothetical protein